MLSSQSKKKKTKKSSKMMRRRERGEVLEAPEIPLDLQIEILNRLPMKSLARFKCVSKLWSSLISSKGYLFASPPRLYISLIEETRHDPAKLVLYSLTSTSKSNTVFDIDSRLDGIGGFDMVALRGLILYNILGQTCIYNPTTGQRVTLPAIKLAGKEFIKKCDYFLGYDPVLDQYKVVCAVVVRSVKYERVYTQHWVFVLEAGSSWRRIEFDQPHIPTNRRGLCINGVIYYFTSSSRSVFGDTIISFNVRYEEFNMIQVPEYSGCLGIVEYGGKPTIFDYKHLRDSLVNLWVLEDVGIWSKKSLDLQPCHKRFFNGSINFDVVGTTQKGEVFLKPLEMFFPSYMVYYDLHNNSVRRVYIRGKWEYPISFALMDVGESIMHLKI